MKPEDLLREALDIYAPWQIIRMRNDLGKGQIDIWVARQAPKSGWFFTARSSIEQGRESVWRHINIGNARCMVHAAPGSSAGGENLQWFGEEDQPFTLGLSRKIASMLMEGFSFSAVCTTLDISVSDLWKFKHRLDSGKSGLSGKADAGIDSSTPDHSAIPESSDARWEKLLNGSISIDIRVLSLKLLLTKLREQYSVISDHEVRMLKTHELQRYFVRHEKLLSHELAQLARF